MTRRGGAVMHLIGSATTATSAVCEHPEMHELPAIHSGHLLFVEGSSEGFGAVRTVRPHGRPELVVWVENAGEFTVALAAVKSAHDGKVVVDAARLEPALRAAIGRAHDGEA